MTPRWFENLKVWIIIGVAVQIIAFLFLILFFRATLSQLDRIEQTQAVDIRFRWEQGDRIEEQLEHIDSHYQGGNYGTFGEPTPTEEAR